MTTRRRRAVWRFSLCLIVWLAPATAIAQDEPDQSDAAAIQPATWRWQADASAFFGLNHQEREFSDFAVWESQNWIALTGERTVGRSSVRLKSMFSLEPFTLRDIGSPQVFQTGETYRGSALVDYQHPHDLVMQLGADVRIPVGPAAILVGADAVGSPSLGPMGFMHRPSAAFNPQAPLSHHHLDATHITPGVVRVGVQANAWTVEGAWFRGREPDENRTDLDLNTLDSYAVRVSWSRAAWYAQASAGWLKAPEAITPYDATRLTASVSYTQGHLAWFAGFGQKREIHGNLEAYLFEASWRLRPRDALFTRVESVAKDILDIGFHPVGTFHRHRQSQVGAATLGYVRDFSQSPAGAFGVGADVTGYVVPANLKQPYGAPISFHVFFRYRLREFDSVVHVH